VRRALGKEPGVANVGVDLGQHHIAVTFDEGATSLDHLLRVLEEAGYPSKSVS
jgi:copper chaperone CopZ